MSSPILFDKTPPGVVVGVDTHADTHTACVLNADTGARLGSRKFRTDGPGYQALIGWAGDLGTITGMGIEQTGTYGAALARAARRAGVADLVEINQPSRGVRATKGKTDALDAESAARSVLNNTAVAVAKDTDGIIEAIRQIKVARASAVKARTAAITQLKSLLITIDDDLREKLRDLSDTQLVTRCASLRPDLARVAEPAQAGKVALRSIAKRINSLTEEAAELHRHLDALTLEATPMLRAEPQVGPVTAAELVIAYGSAGRIRNEAAFARLVGAAPIPASSGKTDRWRLHRGGNRQANKALYMIIIGRMRSEPRTIAFIAERTPPGHSKKPAIRTLKRHIARRVYRLITHDLNTKTGLDGL